MERYSGVPADKIAKFTQDAPEWQVTLHDEFEMDWPEWDKLVSDGDIGGREWESDGPDDKGMHDLWISCDTVEEAEALAKELNAKYGINLKIVDEPPTHLL